MTIRDNYVPAIRDIMAQQGIEAATKQPQYEVQASVSFANAVQYTDWYLTTTGTSSSTTDLTGTSVQSTKLCPVEEVDGYTST